MREGWDTPVLRYLHNVYGARYRYMGLPGVELIDVRLWKDMIDEVIAFEPPDRSDNRRRAITHLRRNMKLMGIPGKAYYGSMEEVVCQGRDYDGLPYTQERIITLYNLDFCNEIASRILTREGAKKVMRFEAIRQILRDQNRCYRRTGGESYFVLMLTFRNQIIAPKIRSFLKSHLLAEADAFYNVCQGQHPIPLGEDFLIGSHPWAIKVFLFNWLSQNFVNPNLSALFFPIVLYEGTQTREGLASPMIHWLILCRFAEDEEQAPTIFPRPYLTNPSVTVAGNGELSLAWSRQHGEAQPGAAPPDPVGWLTDQGARILERLADRA